jgi:hypothetical protein
MPAVNSLTGMIRSTRARADRLRGGATRIAFAGDTGSASDARSRERQERHDQERAQKEAQAEKVMQQQEAERQQQEKERVMEEENIRRQEKHEEDLRKSQEASETQQLAAGQEQKYQGKQDAYEQAKQGLMMGDKEMVQDAMRKLMPDAQDDEITYGKTKGGARKVTARPGKKEMPEFIFHPDGYVGVQLPGRTKPVVFQDAEEAFKSILAPMNPQRYQKQGGATAKDLVTERKNLRTADYQERKLKADIHADANEAAMKQFERDGYYQAATYDEKAYWKVYNAFVEQASGQSDYKPKKRRKGGDQDEPPEGYPNARRAPDGKWYIQKNGKTHEIMPEGEESAAPPKKARPKRSPMPTADEQMPEIEAAGVPGGQGSSAAGRMSLKNAPFPKAQGKQPPEGYPDAQWDEDRQAWFYYDEQNGWQKVEE